MNHSIATADRGTQLKVVVVALIGAIAVVSVGIAARFGPADLGTDVIAGQRSDRAVKVGTVKATKTVTWTSADSVTVR